MPNYSSRHWDEVVGSCVLHGVPMTPCPRCLAEKQPDVRVSFTQEEKEMSTWDNVPLMEHLPADSDWLLDKIMS